MRNIVAVVTAISCCTPVLAKADEDVAFARCALLGEISKDIAEWVVNYDVSFLEYALAVEAYIGLDLSVIGSDAHRHMFELVQSGVLSPDQLGIDAFESCMDQ